nr:hypothetical protein [Mangrovicoccus ximenensis]
MGLVDQQPGILAARVPGNDLAGLQNLNGAGNSAELDGFPDQVEGHTVLAALKRDQPVDPELPANGHAERNRQRVRQRGQPPLLRLPCLGDGRTRGRATPVMVARRDLLVCPGLQLLNRREAAGAGIDPVALIAYPSLDLARPPWSSDRWRPRGELSPLRRARIRVAGYVRFQNR